jgi:hypothetical protein
MSKQTKERTNKRPNVIKKERKKEPMFHSSRVTLNDSLGVHPKPRNS